MKDGHGRTIDYLRISLTDRCNYRCIYCMPEEGVQSMCHTDILRIEEIAHVVRVFSNLGIKSVRLTGGEPLVRKGVVDLVRDINDMPGIKNISLTTNGVLLGHPVFIAQHATACCCRAWPTSCARRGFLA